ncbi:MAG TPA: deacylase [Desulfobulbaceae bacterium]|nr:deacylase [Desulfobulbaceae bacterium]
MKRLLLSILLCCCLLSTDATASNSPLAFSLHKLGSGKGGNTILVIGGIQGDEPGGFHAASLLITHYTIEGGNLWIVPNLNFPSIINRSRGANGDLNRKFAAIAATDPDLEVIQRIKSIIVNPNVDMVLNLHDGSGYYREKYQDDMHGPHRWGQSVIIDQENIETAKFSDLGDIGRKVVANVNNGQGEKTSYRLKNTKTSEGDTEMAKSLTYFAIKQHKSAFGIEASKSLSKAARVSSHLRVIEAFMRYAGIHFKRSFSLDVASVERALSDNRQIAFYDNRVYLGMENIRNKVNYFPVSRKRALDFSTRNPLITVVPSNQKFDVFHGNEKITTLSPEYFDVDEAEHPPKVRFLVDGQVIDAKMGQVIRAQKQISVVPLKGYRVNFIGFSQRGTRDEAGITIKKKDFIKRYSLNTKGNVFRAEFYRNDPKTNGEKFAGMVNISFADDNTPTQVAAAMLPESEIIREIAIPETKK